MTYSCFATLATSLLCLLASLTAAAEPVVRYPQLAETTAWQPLPPESGAALSDAGGFLRLAFPGTEPVRLELREPVALSDAVRDLAFSCTNNGPIMKVKVHLLIRDAEGREFVYNTRSDLKVKAPEGEFITVHGGHRSTEARHHTPGFTFADTRRTIRSPKPGAQPTKPFTWVGLLVEARDVDPRKVPELYFRDFVSSELTPRQSHLHYQFNDRECQGEADGLPHVTPGMFWWWPGTYRIAWDVRADFAGQPFLRGGEEIVATEGGETPLPVQLAKHLEIPVTEQGTYWVRVRICRTDRTHHFKYYERVEEREYRLDVLRGIPAVERRPSAPRDALTFIRITPDRPSLVYEADEPFLVPVEFYRPPTEEQGYTIRLIVRCSLGTEVSRLETTPEWSEDGVWRTVVDLDDAPPGGYRVDATMVDPGGHDFDTTRRTIARREAVRPNLAPIPESVISAQQLLASEEPMFHLDATYEHKEWQEDPQKVWETAMRPFLDEAGTVSKDIEVTVYWNRVEPVPGVYDWRDLDRFLDYAQQKKLRVLLRLDFRGNSVPEWLPAQFVQTQAGNVFGHTAYLFHGMQPNYFGSQQLRGLLDRYLLEAVKHFRGHRAVQGYYWVAEHPGDSPWSGFIGGYSPETTASYHAWLQRQYPTLEACNAALRTNFADWREMAPAQLDDPPLYRLAWLRYRQSSVDAACRDFVEQTRRIDPVRLLMLYATQHDPRWLVERGCMTANGGSHDGFIPTYLGLALDGFQMRNEEITPRFWSGGGTYQLPRTVFHAAIAGGAHTHCKAFIATWKRFAECQEPPYALAAYTDYQRIWRELRQTQPMPVETYVFLDEASFLLERDTVGASPSAGGWPIINFMSAHLPVALAGHEHWQHAKLLLASAQYVEMLEQRTIDQLVAYVENGGQVYLRADAGRTCLEQPDEDWVLLRQLGFAPPDGPMDGRYMQATTTDGKPFRIRDFWKTEPQGETLATIDGSAFPAISRKPFGKGRVTVRWAQTDVPAIHSGGYPILADIATDAGVVRHALTDSPYLWAYLLKHRDKAIWYGLVYNGPKDARPSDRAVAGRAWWPTLPEGDYRVTELITQADLGIHAGADLRTTGLPLTLNPQQVVIYRLDATR